MLWFRVSDDELECGTLNYILCFTMSTKTRKPGLESMRNICFFVQAKTIMNNFKSTTKFSKHMRQPGAHLTLKSTFPVAYVL